MTLRSRRIESIAACYWLLKADFIDKAPILAGLDKLNAQIFGKRYATLEKLKRE